MFSNLMYFLIALVIYTTSELVEAPASIDVRGVYYSIGSAILFTMVCRFSFKRLAQKGDKLSLAGMDQGINTAISRLSITALMLFAANIYLFRLNHLFKYFSLFQWVPTLEAVLFLGLFLCYLVLIWNAAYRVQKRYLSGRLTKKDFIFSNIAFSLPALLPWFCLSLISDLIGVLPFDWVKTFFSTSTGEILYILVFLLAVSIFGPVLIQRLWGCRTLEPGYSREKIEGCCQMAGLKYRDILKWELFGGTMITAGVMGIVGRFRYILVTPALLNALDDDEVDGVIIHEIGHVQRFHMIFYLFFFVGFIACNFVFFEPVLLMLYVVQPLYLGFEWVGISKATAHPLLICIGLISVFIVYFRFIFGFFMRLFERQADLHIFNFKDSPSALISTFYKIASYSRQSIDKPNWHHFSIGQRIRFLDQCRDNPDLIRHHHQRVRKMILVYAVLVVLVFSLGFSISYGRLNKPFGQYVAGKILAHKLAVDPENSDLYVFVGDYYYNENQYEKARDAYENVILIDPENIHALNNLAWLLTTCPQHEFRQPQKALGFARRALELKEVSFILDTYAEALFINDLKEEALDAAKKALALASENKAYYRDQVIRFENRQ